jgi:hypothetical protein
MLDQRTRAHHWIAGTKQGCGLAFCDDRHRRLMGIGRAKQVWRVLIHRRVQQAARCINQQGPELSCGKPLDIHNGAIVAVRALTNRLRS